MRQALELALEALEGFIPYLPLKDEAQCNRYDKAITAIKEALAQPDQYAKGYADAMNWKVQNHLEHLPAAQKPVAWKLMPKKPTEEMLKAMDECSTEGYDERLYAGHAASVYMAAWDDAPTPPQPERYITDAMKVRQAVAQALLDDVYAEELEQPEAKQSGTISITTPAPIAYLCENATGHKYFRWKKPSNVYKPIPLYTTPPQRTWVGLTDEEIADCAEKMEASDPTDSFWREFFRGIEAKLKEKNT